MRQSGVLAAAAVFALEHHRARLAEDHDHAQLLARGLEGVPGARVDPARVDTNIVNIELDGPSAEPVIARARELGVLISSIAPRCLRAVTHLDVSRADIDEAGERMARVLSAARG